MPQQHRLGPVKPNLSLVENPAFIGSIIDVLVGINLVDFIEILIKSFIKHTIGVNLVKITKLGREIIKISIISPVQTHKLPFLHGIHRNFDIFPQRCILKQVFTPIWGTIGEILPISTKFTYF